MLIFFSIILIAFLCGAEVDICVSSLPEIRNLYNVSHFQAELVLGINLLFHCIAVFILGLYGDRYNKEKMINIGMIFFIISSFACAFANSFNSLLFFRAIQGIAIAGPMSFCQLLIFEYFKKEEHDSKMSKLNGFCTLGVSLAPLIGSYITMINWRLNFIFLAIFGIITLIIFDIAVKRSKKIEAEKQKDLSKVNIKDYLKIITSKRTMIYILTTAIGIAAYYSFVGMSSIIYVEGFGVDIKHFGFYQGSLILSFGLFSIINPYIIKKVGKIAMFKISLTLIAIFLIGNISIITLNIKNPNIVTPLLACWSIGVTYPLNTIYVKTLNTIENSSAKINAIMTLFRWLLSIFGFQLASYFFTGDFRASGIIILIFYSIVLSGWYYLQKKDKLFY